MKLAGSGVVRGATMVAFQNDEGETVEGNSLFVDVEMNSKYGGFGSRTEAMRCKDKSVIERIKSIPFPFDAVFELEQLATKGKVTVVVVDCKPARAQAKAA